MICWIWNLSQDSERRIIYLSYPVYLPYLSRDTFNALPYIVVMPKEMSLSIIPRFFFSIIPISVIYVFILFYLNIFLLLLQTLVVWGVIAISSLYISSLCWWRYMFRYITKQVESYIWCSSYSHFYTGRISL